MNAFQTLSRTQLIALVASYKSMEKSLVSMISEAGPHMKAEDPKAAFATIANAFSCIQSDLVVEQSAILEMAPTMEPGPCDIMIAQGAEMLQLQANYITKQTEQINHLMAMIGEFGDMQTALRADFMNGMEKIMSPSAGPSSDQSLN
jgi:hypothetical protein